MTAPPFTPGDWTADEERLLVQTADHKLDVAQVLDDGSCPADQLKADVHLLAASKALYGSLLELVTVLRDEGTYTPETERARSAVLACGLAIAQAEGHR